ncbi:serine hydrolase domain-containing protein [Pseudomonas sp. REB1044]|uniref:serine hydrolase domain-containing protein n=1 Tax=Pseudomonas sp. REB1044 TaxID=2675224 RepID=UPI00315D6517
MSYIESLSTLVDHSIDKALEEQRIVGAVVMVAKDGQVLYRRASGKLDREGDTAMREDAIFRLSSVSKPMVTVAAMRLVERGVIHLGQPVTHWLKDFRPKLQNGTEPTITVHHLLAHVSGLSYGFFEPEGSAYHALQISDGLDQPGLSLNENLRRLAKAPLAFEPGSSWRYSLATDVLGAVLEAATGHSLAQIIREEITRPLGLPDTGFNVTDRARLAVPYANAEGAPVRMDGDVSLELWGGQVKFNPERILHPESYASGGCGMAGTAQDVMQFLLKLQSGEQSLVKPETLSMMMKDHAGPQAQSLGPGWGFGYGWAVLDNPDAAATPQAKGTLQWGGVYGHSWFIDPVNNFTAVILTNTAFEGMSGQLVNDVRDAIYYAK